MMGTSADSTLITGAFSAGGAVTAAVVATAIAEHAIRRRSAKSALLCIGPAAVAATALGSMTGESLRLLLISGAIIHLAGTALNRHKENLFAWAIPSAPAVLSIVFFFTSVGIAASAILVAISGLYIFDLRAWLFGEVELGAFVATGILVALGASTAALYGARISVSEAFAITPALLILARLAAWGAGYPQRRLFRKVKGIIEALKEGRPLELPAGGGDEVHNLADAVHSLTRAVLITQADLRGKLMELEDRERVKQEFLQNLSHELRTPLTGVLGNADLLLHSRRYPLKPDQARYAQVVMEQANNLLRIIDDLLLYAQIDSSRGIKLMPRKLDIGALAGEVVSKVKPLARHKKISLELKAREVWGNVDPKLVRQAVWHLVTNALKFTPVGGEVKVEVRSAATWAEIVVEDNGMGINPGHIERLFDGFRQGDGSASRTHGGLGLGLALVKAIATAHGGEVHVASEPGKGSRFILKIPADRGWQSLSPELPSAPGKNLVLVYTKDRVLYDLIREHLKGTSLDVGGVFRSSDLFDAALGYNPRALIIAPQNGDWGDSGPDGKPSLRRQLASHKATAHLPVVIITQGKNAGQNYGDVVLEAPFKKEELISALKHSIRLKKVGKFTYGKGNLSP